MTCFYRYNEIADYDYATQKSKNGNATGHFTAMVWRGSKKVGYGYATRRVNALYVDVRGNKEYRTDLHVVVARYSPPGNWQGEFVKNVGVLKKEGEEGKNLHVKQK